MELRVQQQSRDEEANVQYSDARGSTDQGFLFPSEARLYWRGDCRSEGSVVPERERRQSPSQRDISDVPAEQNLPETDRWSNRGVPSAQLFTPK